MCRSPVFIVGYLVLVIAAVACALSFVAPFWMLYSNDYSSMNTIANRISQFFTTGAIPTTEGLWAKCYKVPQEGCSWYWENDFKEEKTLQDWQMAVQGLFGFGLLLILIVLLVSSVYLCCCFCCKESSAAASSTLGSLCLSGASCIGSAIGVWGGFISKQDHYSIMTFYWAFYVAIGGAVAAIVASIIFFCDGCRARSYTGYHMTRVV